MDWRVPLALLATYVFFGSGPAATAVSIKTMPPFAMVAVRGVIAGAILTIWSIAAGAPWPTLRNWRAASIIGALILACGAGAGTYGQLTIPSGVAGVLSALLPLFAACLGYLLFRERPGRQTVIGLVIGFAGVGLLLRPGSGLDPFGVVVILGGQLAWALGAELAPRVGLPDDPRLAAGLELLAGGGALFVMVALLGGLDQFNPAPVSLTSWLGFAWFVVIGIGGFTAFGFLTQTVSPSVATTFAYVNPIVAITLGWLLFGEAVSVRMIVATAVIIGGVCLIVSAKSEPGRPHHPLTSGHGHRRRTGDRSA